MNFTIHKKINENNQDNHLHLWDAVKMKVFLPYVVIVEEDLPLNTT